MAEVRVDLVSDFKDKGFKKAASATDKLEKSFKRLGKQFIGIFAARKVINFTRNATVAFAEEDKAIRSLSYSLQNLGLAFEGANIEKFLAQTERATSVAVGTLRPAFQQLVSATLDVTKAQELLNLALNVSAGTGKDVATVSNALSKAYLKDVSALGKLNVGLTAAQLKTMSFAEAQEELNKKFSGQAAAQADTYAGKISALNNTLTKASETIGEKFIRSLEIINDGDFDGALDAIAKAAKNVGDAFIRAGYGIEKVRALLRGDFGQIKKLQEQMNIELMGGTGVTAKPVAGVLAKQLAAQKKLLAAQEAARKKAEALEKKKEAERLARKRASTIFDIDNIQVVAALQGKIDGEERARLVALLALQTDNVTAAEKLADIVIRLNEPALSNLGVMIKAGDTIDDVIKKLITSQAKLAGLQLLAEDFPELDNPFEEWETTLENILALLLQILNMNTTKGAASFEDTHMGLSESQWQDWRQGERASIVNSSSVGSGTTATNTSFMPNIGGGGATVIVNVAGNVTTERDLVSAITDQIYVQQKSGKQITYNALTI